jgi:lysophospholipase L1-like esterase
MRFLSPLSSPLRLALVVLAAGLLVRPGRADDQPKFAKWEKDIAAFEKRDQEKPPPKNGIVFVGSSSIRLWDLAKSFPGVNALNRGFGGSQLVDSVHFASRIVTKYEPRLVVLYAGDNDLAGGKSPEQVLADFQAFVTTVQKESPNTRIVYLSIKGSIARWKLIDKIRQTNVRIEDYCKQDERLRYVDVATPLLGTDGKPRAELFRKDGLHLNDMGYEVWAAAVKPHLK